MRRLTVLVLLFLLSCLTPRPEGEVPESASDRWVMKGFSISSVTPTVSSSTDPPDTLTIAGYGFVDMYYRSNLLLKVYIDDGYSGTLQPGNQLSKTVSVGDHKIYARSDEGAVWGPFSVTVTANGLRQTLSCGW